MKRSFIVIIFLLFNFFGISQKLKEVTIKFDKSKQISKQYTVLKKDKKVKHGLYTSYFEFIKSKLNYSFTEEVKEKGNYKNGKKNGYWIENLTSSKRKEGYYKDGEKIGVWKTIHKKYKIVNLEQGLEKEAGIFSRKVEIGHIIERYNFNDNVKLQPIIYYITNYPAFEKENGIEGIVKIKYSINNNCEIFDVVFMQGVSENCDKEAFRALNFYFEMKKKYGSDCEEKSDVWIVNFKL